MVRCRRVNSPFRISGDVCREVFGGPSSERIRTFAASDERDESNTPSLSVTEQIERERQGAVHRRHEAIDRARREGGIIADLQLRGGQGSAEIPADKIDDAADNGAFDFGRFALERCAAGST